MHRERAWCAHAHVPSAATSSSEIQFSLAVYVPTSTCGVASA